MKNAKYYSLTTWSDFLFLLIVTSSISVGASFPNAALPLGSPDLPEIRTIREIRPGLTHIDIKRGNTLSGEAPMSVQIVILDPKIYRGKIISAWSEAGWLTSPYELALRDNAVVAANASYYEFSQDDIQGIPSALSIVQGVWHHEHDGYEGWPFLAIENTDEGPKLSIEYEVPPRPYINLGGKRIEIDGFDRAPKRDQSEIVVMRRSLLEKSDLSHGKAERNYTVTIINEKSSGLPYYIIASGAKEKELQEAIDSGVPLEVDLSVPGRLGLNVFFANYAMIINGETPEVDNTAAHTRTTVGADAEGNIYLIVVGPEKMEREKRNPSLVTLHELQGLGKFLNLINYYNLDGGTGSVSMVIEKQTVGPPIPFYRENRRVSDSILIVDSE